MAAEARVMVECSVCTLAFDVSARTHRDMKAGKYEPRCRLHRKRRPRPATVNAAARRFWLERWSLDEIREVAGMIWPTPKPAAPGPSGALMALALSHEDRPPQPPVDQVVLDAARAARRQVRTHTAA